MQANYNNLSINNSYPQLGGGTPDTPPSAIGSFTLICKLSQTRFGGWVYRTASSTQTSSFTVQSYLAFSPVSGVVESADLDDVKVIGYKLYEKIALLDGSEINKHDLDIVRSRIKSGISRLAKLSNPEFTEVNEELRSKRNAEITFLGGFLWRRILQAV